ncbi:hypothetical protein [Pseudonocardia sp. H11422]|uniref:hypothetical protein n=1 Tax=Pseudonocardia sp. H11422 TaxID=2835866 RepID=UPI001BDD3296|nr:hypothetical protein [Pseudonocardia sp. H11422]
MTPATTVPEVRTPGSVQDAVALPAGLGQEAAPLAGGTWIMRGGARGETPPIIPVAAAIASAVADAIGRPLHRLPMTPFDVLAALGEPAGADGGEN